MLMLALLAAAAAPASKTTAMDDWRTLAIYGVGGSTSAPLLLQVHAGDLDGDGVPDDAVVKLVCADGRLTEALYKTSPRDASSGMATGRGPRQTTSLDGSFGAAPAELSAMKPTYDIKTLKGARTAADGWTAISLSQADGLCGAAQAAATAIVKSKSNITNN